MKTKTGMAIIGLFLFSGIFCSCNPINKNSIPTGTITPEIRTPEITPTSILEDRFKNVPILKEISCIPAENPYKRDTDYDKFLYEVMGLPSITISRKCTFSGHISRGDVYIHQINNNLIFCLVPGGVFRDVPDEGWYIVITDSRSKTCTWMNDGFDNFGPIITAPNHGNMFFDVFGWHFRNSDNSGPNDGSVNAPQEVREFNFLFSEEDYKKIWYSTRCSQWKFPEDCTSATQYPMSHSDTILHSRAQFTISNLTLGNLVTNSHAWIEEMDFTVDVYLPDEE